ncbi:hypothetical protein [uncultured Eubacterium sp.]|uniref:hypothetical protein n=1 Tax=uncultured Eubacterium sp. TaxID=165185 RepID=UPI0025949854|nr:hypothetical protein [uncultured Eubacterium sp.]
MIKLKQVFKFWKETIYYSTPFGDHKDGDKRLFLMPGPDNTGYFPVFTTEEDAKVHFELAGRVGYVLMNATFHDVLLTVKQSNEGEAPVKMGVLIDPARFKVTVDVANLDDVIIMTE